MTHITFIDLGLTDFVKAWQFQKDLVAHRKYNGGNDVLIFCEHEPVITLGRGAKEENLLCKPEQIKEKGIDFVKIDRGGDVTFHAPGQLIAYPIFDLKKRSRDIRLFMRDLEKVVINTLLFYNIESYAGPTKRGVWTRNKKICSLGIGVSGWFSYHGIALNVNNDLAFFKYIKPCGLEARVMTSLSEVSGHKKNIDQVKRILQKEFIKVFDYHF